MQTAQHKANREEAQEMSALVDSHVHL
jgi:hypothetical protein